MMGPEDIELGDEVIHVDRPKRAGVVVSVRLSAEEGDRLCAEAERLGTTVSRVAREAITTYHTPVLPAGPEWTATLTGPGTLVLSYPGHGNHARTVGRAMNIEVR